MEILPLQESRNSSVIIDTDVGGDDLMAIAFLLAQRDVNIEAITVCNGLAHVDQGARNVLRLLELSGRKDIPVFIGRSTPLQGSVSFPEAWRRTSDSLLSSDLPQTCLAPQREPASDYLFQRLGKSNSMVRLLTLGPLTNIGDVLRRDPERSRTIEEIVISGGAVYVPGNLGDGGYYKTDNVTAEWNMFVDPLAATIVFRSGIPTTLVPLDATNSVRIDGDFLRAFQNSQRSPLARVVGSILEANWEYIETGFYFAWDPLVAAICLNPDIASLQPTAIRIRHDSPNEGQTEPVPGERVNVNVALEPKVEAFREMFFGAFRNQRDVKGESGNRMGEAGH